MNYERKGIWGEVRQYVYPEGKILGGWWFSHLSITGDNPEHVYKIYNRANFESYWDYLVSKNCPVDISYKDYGNWKLDVYLSQFNDTYKEATTPVSSTGWGWVQDRVFWEEVDKYGYALLGVVSDGVWIPNPDRTKYGHISK